MDIFDFEELVAEILDITDEQREDDDYLPSRFEEHFEMDFEAGYKLAKALLLHTTKVQGGLSGTEFNAFISRKGPYMLMKQEVQ
jgi:hypothetical protein